MLINNKLTLVTFLIFITLVCNAQSVGIGTDHPDEGAILDIVSLNKGLLIPRLDTINVNAPQLGMMVLLAGTSNIYKYNGSRWESLGKVAIMLEDDDRDTWVKLIEKSNDDLVEMGINGTPKFNFGADSMGRSRIGFMMNNLNISIGKSTMQRNTSGNSNIALGNFAMQNNTSGSGNVAIGISSQTKNKTGVNNIAIGNNTLEKNEVGFQNTTIGLSSSKERISGYNNTSIGFASLELNTVGNLNTVIGAEALINNTEGSGNVAIGNNAGGNELGSNKLYIENSEADSNDALIYGEFDNDFLRFNAEVSIKDRLIFSSDSTGRSRISFPSNKRNVAIGENTLRNNTSGFANTALGEGSLASSKTGISNTGLGTSALSSNVSGSFNVSVGAGSLQNNTSGMQNVGLGVGTLDSNEKGVQNVAVGYGALFNANNGSGNVALGNLAGFFERGSNKLFIENSSADENGALIYGEFDNDFIRLNGDLDVSGYISLGGNYGDKAKLEVYGTGSQNYTLTAAYYNAAGNSSIFTAARPLGGWFEQHVAAKEFQAFSDARIKNIRGITDSAEDLCILSKIEVTDYQFIDSIGSGNQLHKKVIAQQVREVYPQAVQACIKDFVPNIYQLTDIKDGWISISAEVEVGDRIKVILKDGDKIAQVMESSEEGIRLNVDQEGRVFVFGTEVNDFHTVDYEALSMLNISATQELIKQLESQEKRIIDLEDKVIKLLESRVD